MTTQMKYGDTLLDAVDMASNQESVWVECDTCHSVSIQIFWTGGEGTLDGTVKLQTSNEPDATKSNPVDKTGASVTLTAASGAEEISLNTTLTAKFCRVVYTKNNISAGTLSVIPCFKG